MVEAKRETENSNLEKIDYTGEKETFKTAVRVFPQISGTPWQCAPD